LRQNRLEFMQLFEVQPVKVNGVNALLREEFMLELTLKVKLKNEDALLLAN
jgi:hypothetical protein